MIGKKCPALIEESTKNVYIPDQHPLYLRCIPDAPKQALIPLFPTYPRPSGWPIHALHGQPLPVPDTTTLTTLNIESIPDLYAWFQLLASNE